MSERIADEARAAATAAAKTADDTTDGAGIWRDPSGIIALGATPSTAYTPILHVVQISCTSTRNRIAKLRVAWAKPKPGEKRGMCPKCGKMATYRFDTEDSHGVRT